MNTRTDSIFRFWFPLALTWLVMAVEGPTLAAIIARLPEPKFNLGAYGIAFAFGLLLEAPIIMMLTASTAIVKNRSSYQRLALLSHSLNIACTIVTLLIVSPLLFPAIIKLINPPDPIAAILHGALALLIPWPAAIGVRRFYQGILIRHNLPRQVTYCSIFRLVGMLATAIIAIQFTTWPGAWVGTASLSAGVILEAAATWGFARVVVRSLPDDDDHAEPTMTLTEMWQFYYPLALTSSIGLASQPLITFAVGWYLYPIDSLAVLPVIGALIFIFRGLGLSFQEVAVTFMQYDSSGFTRLLTFAKRLTYVFSLSICIIAFSPLARLWFENISGLNTELAQFAILPLRFMITIPAMACIISIYRAIAVTRQTTRVITAGVCVEVVSMFTVMAAVGLLGGNGALAACCGMGFGRLVACVFFELRKETSIRYLSQQVQQNESATKVNEFEQDLPIST